jgi:hypothetical protein
MVRIRLREEEAAYKDITAKAGWYLVYRVPYMGVVLSSKPIISMFCYFIGAETFCAFVIDETCDILSIQINRIL